jgi:hypothetical protein
MDTELDFGSDLFSRRRFLELGAAGVACLGLTREAVAAPPATHMTMKGVPFEKR